MLRHAPWNWLAWHPSGWWDWCDPEDEKRDTEKL